MRGLLSKILPATFAVFVASFTIAFAVTKDFERSLDGTEAGDSETYTNNTSVKKIVDAESAEKNRYSLMTFESACRECSPVAFDKYFAMIGDNAREYIKQYRGKRGATLAHELCSNEIKDLESFVKILDRLVAVWPRILNQKDVNGNTPLHYAIYGSGSRVIGAEEDAKKFPTEETWKQRRLVVEELLKRSPTLVDVADNRGNTPLHCAVMRTYTIESSIEVEFVRDGNPEMVNLLLEYGARIDAKNSNGQTPLHTIFDGRNFDRHNNFVWVEPHDSKIVNVAKLLISKGANVVETDGDKNTILHLAVLGFGIFMTDENDKSLFDLLLKSGVDINAENCFGMTPLDFAEGIKLRSPTKSDLVKLESLKKWFRENGGNNGSKVESYPKLVAIATSSPSGSGKIHKNNSTKRVLSIEGACRALDYEALTSLINNMGLDGAKNVIAHYRSQKKGNLLHEICSSEVRDFDSFVKILDILLSASPTMLEGKDSNGDTPLQYAIMGGPRTPNFETSRDLISFWGIEVTRNGRRAVAEELLRRKPALIDIANNDGATPLHSAIWLTIFGDRGDPQMVELLLKYGAKTEAKDSNGDTPLFSVFNSKPDIRAYFGMEPVKGEAAKLLIAGGANVTMVNKSGSTIMHLAVSSNYHEIMQDSEDVSFFDALLKAGANINAQDKSGRTPLDIIENAHPKGWIKSGGTDKGKKIRDTAAQARVKKWLLDNGAINGVDSAKNSRRKK